MRYYLVLAILLSGCIIGVDDTRSSVEGRGKTDTDTGGDRRQLQDRGRARSETRAS